MILGNLERLVDHLLDGDGRYDDDELGEAVAFVQLEDRAQVDISLAGPRLHLHSEVAGIQGIGGWQTVTELNDIQVFEDFLIEQGQSVADAEVVFGEGVPRLGI